MFEFTIVRLAKCEVVVCATIQHRVFKQPQ